MVMTTRIKESIEQGCANRFRGLVHCHLDGEQADMVLEKQLRPLHVYTDLQAIG